MCPFAWAEGFGRRDDAAQVFEAGADKVSVNSAALKDPGLIDAIGRSFGAQAVVVAIDARRDPEAADPVREAQVYVQGGRKQAGRRVVEWAREAEERGAGEILLTSMNPDGMRTGFDCELTAAVSEAVRHSRDRFGRRGNGGAFCRCVWAREGRCGTGGEHFSFWRFECAVAQRRAGAGGCSGEAAMLIPSIDLLGGRIVQLVQGENCAWRLTILNIGSRSFRKFPLVQLIDLDAAMRQGENSALVAQIAKRLPVQAGGGIHTVERARQVLEAGAQRVIIGSALFSAEGTVNTEFAAELAAAVGAERVVAGIDTKNGRIAVKGWKAQVELTPDEAIPQLEPYAACVSVHARGWRGNVARVSLSRRGGAAAEADEEATDCGGRDSQPAGSGCAGCAGRGCCGGDGGLYGAAGGLTTCGGAYYLRWGLLPAVGLTAFDHLNGELWHPRSQKRDLGHPSC